MGPKKSSKTSKVSTAALSKPQTRRMLKAKQDQSSLKDLVDNLVASSTAASTSSTAASTSTSSTATRSTAASVSTAASSKPHTRRTSKKSLDQDSDAT